MKADRPQLDSMTAALRELLRLGGHVELSGHLPWGKVVSANFIRKHRQALEQALGRQLEVTASHYYRSGRGVFGRLQAGGPRAKYFPLSIKWLS